MTSQYTILYKIHKKRLHLDESYLRQYFITASNMDEALEKFLNIDVSMGRIPLAISEAHLPDGDGPKGTFVHVRFQKYTIDRVNVVKGISDE